MVIKVLLGSKIKLALKFSNIIFFPGLDFSTLLNSFTLFQYIYQMFVGLPICFKDFKTSKHHPMWKRSQMNKWKFFQLISLPGRIVLQPFLAEKQTFWSQFQSRRKKTVSNLHDRLTYIFFYSRGCGFRQSSLPSRWYNVERRKEISFRLVPNLPIKIISKKDFFLFQSNIRWQYNVKALNWTIHSIKLLFNLWYL